MRYGGQGWGYSVYVGTPNITIANSLFTRGKDTGIYFEGEMPAALARNRFPVGNTIAAAWLSSRQCAHLHAGRRPGDR